MRVWEIRVVGIVQSVGFRPFVKRLADKIGIKGTVQNTGGGVRIIAVGGETELEEFTEKLKSGPELTEVFNMEIEETREEEEYSDFKIIKSSGGAGFSPLPPDIAICQECVSDLKVGRRREYPFTSCTNCGPRYCVIRSLPYDRKTTAFGEFPLCSICDEEYRNINNRRYHAQTTCCQECGPRYIDANAQEVDWRKVVKDLKESKVIFLLGQSGSTLIVNARSETAVSKLRSMKRHDGRKPFALMMRSLQIVEKYCTLTERDRQILVSSRRPIVVLPFKTAFEREFPVKVLAPALDTIGVVLPYNATHHILFENQAPDVLVYTSANQPGIPMYISKPDWKGVDRYLIHNCQIVQRVDDSVVKSLGEKHVIIRRARGYVAQPLFHTDIKQQNALALGAEEVNTAAFSKDGWIVPTQHIGTLQNSETLNFLRDSISHLKRLYDFKVDHLIVDLHPDFMNRLLLSEVNKEAEVHEVQHHIAHAHSLLVDRNLPLDESYLIWAVDGYGYGIDGNAWGTELFYLSHGITERVASAVSVGYTGGDRNAKNPGRMNLIFMLEAGIPIEPQNIHSLKHGEIEFQYLKDNYRKGKVTTSVARLFDAVAHLLTGIQNRSYRGEPAIVLEAIAGRHLPIGGKPVIKWEREFPQVDSIALYKKAHEMKREGRSNPHIASTVLNSVGMSLAEIAILMAQEYEVKGIGLSGGVAYNYHINRVMEEELKRANIDFIQHRNVPPGDGGISIGQLLALKTEFKHT